MESDVQNILDSAEVMKVSFRALEARGMRSFCEPDMPDTIGADRFNAIRSAANTFRFFEGIELSLLRAAFDREYAEEIEELNKKLMKGR